jgi:hypothetical protein
MVGGTDYAESQFNRAVQARREPVIAAARDLGISTPIARAPSLALGTFDVEFAGAHQRVCRSRGRGLSC